MRSNKSYNTGLRALMLVPLFFLVAGFAAQQAGTGRSPDQAVTLAYQFPEEKTLAYRQSGTETQNIEIMGSTMMTESQSTLEFTLKPKGMKDGNFRLGVTIDTFKASIQGAQGNISPDTGSVPGKSFDLILSRLGKEIDTSGASSIQFDIPSAGKQDLTSRFQAFFPDLPDRAVKIGDTWPSEDAITQKSDAGEILIKFKNVNTFDGFETVDGIECARIKTVLKGTMTGELQQGGVGLSMDCTIEGTETHYFAIKEGFFVKADSKAGFGGFIKAGEPMNANIPISGEDRSETRLIKK